MATYNSEIIRIPAPAEQVYGKLTNLEALRDLLAKVPADRIPAEHQATLQNLQITPDSITIPAGPVGAITLRVSRREPPRLIALQGEGSPVPISLTLHITPLSETESEAQAEIDIDVPFMLKPMINGPMQQMVGQFGQILKAINFD